MSFVKKRDTNIAFSGNSDFMNVASLKYFELPSLGVLKLDPKYQYDDEISPEEREIQNLKLFFDNVEYYKFTEARNANNPYEKITSRFNNRAALKLLELDIAFKLFDDSQRIMLDVCSGPGGFSEYALTKKRYGISCYGLTLKNYDNDFKVCEFNPAAQKECFFPHYGVTGDGDITELENIKAFLKYVGSDSCIVTGDGGFKFDDENEQETEAARMVLCEFYIALASLRNNGNFVCKLFLTNRKISKDMIMMMSTFFSKVYICKPKTSRVANSERFLVCKSFKKDLVTPEFLEQLEEIISDKEKFPKSLFIYTPRTSKFREEMERSNIEFMKDQIIELKKVVDFIKKHKKITPEQTRLQTEFSYIFRPYTNGGPNSYVFFDDNCGSYMSKEMAISILKQTQLAKDACYMFKSNRNYGSELIVFDSKLNDITKETDLDTILKYDMRQVPDSIIVFRQSTGAFIDYVYILQDKNFEDKLTKKDAIDQSRIKIALTDYTF